MNINKVFIAGRLTKDPELRTTNGGNTVATFSVATSQTWKDKSGQKQEKSSFHNIVLWGRLGEISGQYLTKGQEVFIEGRIETRSYDAKDGSKRYVTEIIAQSMQMGNKPKSYQEGNSPKNSTAPAAVKEDEIPTINLDDESGEQTRIEDIPF